MPADRSPVAALLLLTLSALSGCPGPTPSGPSAGGEARVVSGTLPFGPDGVPETLFGRPFSGGYRVLNGTPFLRDTLERARTAGVRLVVRPVGGKWRYQDADGSFSLAKWKAELDAVREFDFEPYVRDGTVVGIELMNEPHVAEKWGGRVISKEELDEAAAYAKSFWPYLPVGAGRTDYLLERAPWRHLDFANSQYHMRKGDVSSWLVATEAEARGAGVGLMLSLNFFGGEVGDTPMTPQEVVEVGRVLAASRSACALAGYVYDPAYFSRPGITDAFQTVAAVANSHPAPPCYAGQVK